MSTIDIEAIATAWQGLGWQYGEEREGDYLACAYLFDGIGRVLDLEEPTEEEQIVLRAMGRARDDIEALLTFARAAAAVIDLVVEDGDSTPALDAALSTYLELRYGPPASDPGATMVPG